MNLIDPHTPTTRHWSELVVRQLFQTIVNHDGLAFRHNVKMECYWCYENVLGGVKIWINPGTPDAMLLATVVRDPDRNMKAELISEFKTVRKLVMLL
jgi:hypothetical protein